MIERQKYNITMFEDIFSKLIKKGDKFLEQFEKDFQFVLTDTPNEYHHVLNYFIALKERDYLSIVQQVTLIQIYQTMVYVIKVHKKYGHQIHKLVEIILDFFTDPSEKVKISSITSIYNIFSFLQDDCLPIFIITFKQIPNIIIDPSWEVRQAACHLNHTMKTLLYNAIEDRCLFDIDNFMIILTESFALNEDPLIKEFLIDWINTADQIRQFQILVYLPMFLKKLFTFLCDQNENVRMKAEDCLKGFIDSFQQFFTCQKDQIGKRFNKSDIESILLLLIKIIEENILFSVSPEIHLYVLAWLKKFSQFLIDEIQQNLKPFLIHIFRNIFLPLLTVLLKALSSDCDKVVKQVVIVHENLQRVYSKLQINDDALKKCAVQLKKKLHELCSVVQVEMMIRWTTIISHRQSSPIHESIQQFTNSIIIKICDGGAKYISRLENSVFSTNYFPLFVRLLLLQIMHKKCSSEFIILEKIISLPNSEQNFLIVCQKLNEIMGQDHKEFKERMANTLLTLLICDNSLQEFREKVKRSKDYCKVHHIIYETFSWSKAALLGICFLKRRFTSASKIIQSLTQQIITSKMLKSFKKVLNCLLSPAMYDVILIVQSNPMGQARKAFLSLVMLLPINKHTQTLTQKIKLWSKIAKTSSDNQNDLCEEDLNEEIWEIYKKTCQYQ